jgi:hypothetical protein
MGEAGENAARGRSSGRFVSGKEMTALYLGESVMSI